MSPAAWSQVADELTDLAQRPLLAPTTFARVAWLRRRRSPNPATGASAGATAAAGSAPASTAGASEAVHESQGSRGMQGLHTLGSAYTHGAGASGYLAATPAEAEAVAALRRWQLAPPPLRPPASAVAALAAADETAASSGGSGAPTGTAPGATATAALPSPTVAASPASASAAASGSWTGGSAGVGAGGAGGDVGAGGQGARLEPWRGEAEVLAEAPPWRLSGMLAAAAAARVPLRRSALQAYADALSARAGELSPSEVLTALEGLAAYGFADAQPQPLQLSQPPQPPREGQSWVAAAEPAWAAPVLQRLLLPAAPGPGLAAPQAAQGQALGAPEAGVRALELLVQLRIQPGSAWLPAFLAAAPLPGAPPGGRGGPPAGAEAALQLRLLRALARMGQDPGEAWWLGALRSWRPPGLEGAGEPAAGPSTQHSQPAGDTDSRTGSVPVPDPGRRRGSAVADPGRNPDPGASEVRCELLHTAARAGFPPALAPVMAVWAEAALYDTARLYDMGPTAGGPLATSRRGVDGSDGWEELPPPPAALVRALAALPRVMPGAAAWVSRPGGPGAWVLGALMRALRPRLWRLEPGQLLELLQGLAASRLHPGRPALRTHAAALAKAAGAGALPPIQLLQAARLYRALGYAPSGPLRTAILDAAAVLEKQARAAAAAERAAAEASAAGGLRSRGAKGTQPRQEGQEPGAAGAQGRRGGGFLRGGRHGPGRRGPRGPRTP
ncbi:hypothetical protein HYH03_014217 [Edaphochlamys debaryana]|uniref:Uncharacterized protein n=1 Tax=Edaphochlamys debaryana TaxID=47281 RepID=A0A836BTR0_9CHLO|nr:hypothetical protein HYH03_014217 [Edaphochlamys debaryana]|eukprot:KAG2487104.1 hypothetical protein HYH03_014217 [Edaphochlamys debaryana]